MRQRGYAIAFVLVLLLACAGGLFGGRLLLEQVQQDFAPRSGWTPPVTPPPAPPAVEETVLAPAPGATAAQSPRPTATLLVVATPAGGPAPVDTPARGETPTAGPATLAPGDLATPAPGATETTVETPSPTPAPQPTFPYVLARPVRHTTGDCPGNYIMGQVTDIAGNPLPNVRLKLVDEFGATSAVTMSKAGQVDLGRYDFPLFGTPRRYYLTVVDGADRPLSAEVEIRHGLSPDAGATCHWVDWRRQ